VGLKQFEFWANAASQMNVIAKIRIVAYFNISYALTAFSGSVRTTRNTVSAMSALSQSLGGCF